MCVTAVMLGPSFVTFAGHHCVGVCVCRCRSRCVCVGVGVFINVTSGNLRVCVYVCVNYVYRCMCVYWILFICLERNLTMKSNEKIVDRIIFRNLLVTFRDIIPS